MSWPVGRNWRTSIHSQGHAHCCMGLRTLIWLILNSALCHLGLCFNTNALLKLAETLNTLVPVIFLSCLLMFTSLNFQRISIPTTLNNATWRASRCHARYLLLSRQKTNSSQNASCGPSYANPDLQATGSMKYAMFVGSLPKPWPSTFWEELLRLRQWKEGWNSQWRYWDNIQTLVMSLLHNLGSLSTLMTSPRSNSWCKSLWPKRNVPFGLAKVKSCDVENVTHVKHLDTLKGRACLKRSHKYNYQV